MQRAIFDDETRSWVHIGPITGDIVVWFLSILGTIASVSGGVIGWRYLRH